MKSLKEKYESEAAAKAAVDEARRAADQAERRVGVAKSELRRYAGAEPNKSVDRALEKVAPLREAAEARFRAELREYITQRGTGLLTNEPVPDPPSGSLVSAFVLARFSEFYDALHEEIEGAAAADPSCGGISPLTRAEIAATVEKRKREIDQLEAVAGERRAELAGAEGDLQAAREGE